MFSQPSETGRRFCLSGESGVQIRFSAAKREREEIERKQGGLADSLAMFQEQEAKEEAIHLLENYVDLESYRMRKRARSSL